MTAIQILKHTTSNVLQKMFFMIEETPPERIQENYEFYTYVTKNDIEIHLLFSKKMAEEITENFLGIPQVTSDEEILDCIGEITNMICGNFVGEIFQDMEKMLPLPTSKKIRENIRFDSSYQDETLFYNGQPIKLYFKTSRQI